MCRVQARPWDRWLRPHFRAWLPRFAAEPARKEFAADSALAFERRPLRSGAQTVTFVIDREPKFVGVDPYHKRIDAR